MSGWNPPSEEFLHPSAMSRPWAHSQQSGLEPRSLNPTDSSSTDKESCRSQSFFLSDSAENKRLSQFNHWHLLFPCSAPVPCKGIFPAPVAAVRRADQGWKEGFSCWKGGKAVVLTVKHGIKHTLSSTGTPGIWKTREHPGNSHGNGAEPALRNPNSLWRSHRCTKPNQLQGGAGGGNFLLHSLRVLFPSLFLPGLFLSWLGFFWVEKLIFFLDFCTFNIRAVPFHPLPGEGRSLKKNLYPSDTIFTFPPRFSTRAAPTFSCT